MRFANFEKDENWATFYYKTTYSNNWEMLLGYISVIYDEIINAEILTAELPGAKLEPVDIEIASKDDFYKIKEQDVLVIRGLNKNFNNMPFQFAFFNQTDRMHLEAPVLYIDKLKENTDGLLDEYHIFDKFLDSVEILGHTEYKTRIIVPEILSQYTKALLQYEQAKENCDTDTAISYRWRDFSFPLDNVISTIRNIDFVYKKDDADFLAISVETMHKAHFLLENIVSIKRSADDKNMIEVVYYTGGECTKDNHLEIGSEEWKKKVAENKNNKKTLSTRYFIQSNIRTKCNMCEACWNGEYCVRVIAAYLFYLIHIGQYEEQMDRWKKANADAIARLRREVEVSKLFIETKYFYVPFLYDNEEKTNVVDNTIHYTAHSIEGAKENDINTRADYSDPENEPARHTDNTMRFLKIVDEREQQQYLCLFSTPELLRNTFPENTARICYKQQRIS